MVNKYSKAQPVSVAVVGARGYSGLELSKYLLNHPSAKLEAVFATREFSLADELLWDKAKGVKCLTDADLFNNLADVVFLCTPADVSAELAPKILKAGKTVIDLSHAHRFTPMAAEYGLSPFCGPRKTEGRLIANPGCYATAVEMALIPLLRHDLIEIDTLAIDAKSGTTGAGRKAAESQLFAEVDGECLPYRVGHHQHLPEIKTAVKTFAGVDIDPHFVTHLLPTKRGIETAIFAKAKTDDIRDIQKAFDQEFAGYPLVRHGTDYDRLARLSKVVGTPMTHISYQMTGRKLYLFSVLDNLLKGAASQAVENFNRCLDLPVHHTLHTEA